LTSIVRPTRFDAASRDRIPPTAPTPPSPDDEIDRLYQLPLAAFTPERNALAKRLGTAGGSIRVLEKPSLAAWAVNQLFWRRRAAFNRLTAAAAARRGAHAKLLAGKGGDITAVDAAHGVALSAAGDEIRALLAEAGEAPSSATMHAVTETLQALPGSAHPGRLTKPLKLAGFEALAGLVSTSARTLRGLTPAPAVSRKPRVSDAPPNPRAVKREADARKREEAARRRERAAIETELREARRDATTAAAALADARRTLTRAKDARARLQDQLQFAVKTIDGASGDVRACEERAAKAGQAQAHLEAKLGALTSDPG
jgi:hypothetical protein